MAGQVSRKERGIRAMLSKNDGGRGDYEREFGDLYAYRRKAKHAKETGFRQERVVWPRGADSYSIPDRMKFKWYDTPDLSSMAKAMEKKFDNRGRPQDPKKVDTGRRRQMNKGQRS